ncbi:Ceramide glucosyltransferase [Carpediemonas membranifera]|uniref:ceramide glucosyltransferase n=1 Tax=Carpediemonas membranifera TaxID=201153 RepID=A0A8J6E3K6_9EUKA|nr:Ceramide glucosyltransferase [Carpediemonas membranifera]|eukprot:KAG9395726.1 Ceramide glucosyltransferase [Carpediemonas membranifera]
MQPLEFSVSVAVAGIKSIDSTLCGSVSCTVNAFSVIGLLLVSFLWILLILSRQGVLNRLERKIEIEKATRCDVSVPGLDLSQHQVSMVIYVRRYWHTVISTIDSMPMEGQPPLEVILVTDNDKRRPYKELHARLNARQRSGIPITLATAGLSWHSSQKCHAQLCGVAQTSAQSKYILFMDEDAVLTRSTIPALVHSLATNPDTFAATGLGFDYPVPGTPLWSYLLLAYRTINMTAFITERPNFAWGGCLMMRREDFFVNKYAICDAIRDGAFAIDMTISHICKRVGQTISAPVAAMYSAPLRPLRFGSYLRFVRSQLFVLGTRSQASFDRLQNLLISILIQLMPIVFSLPIWCLFIESPYIWARMLLGFDGCFVSRLFVLILAAACALTLIIEARIVRVYHKLATALYGRGTLEPLHVNPILFTLGMGLHLLLVPLVSIHLLITNRIIVGGVMYQRAGGRIIGVHRPEVDPITRKTVNWRTRAWGTSLAAAIARDHRFGLLHAPTLV